MAVDYDLAPIYPSGNVPVTGGSDRVNYWEVQKAFGQLNFPAVTDYKVATLTNLINEFTDETPEEEAAAVQSRLKSWYGAPLAPALPFEALITNLLNLNR